MNSTQWTALKKQPDKAKKMLSALHMSSAYLKVSWNELDEGDQKKVSKWVSKNASGWFEAGEPTSTPKGIKNVAPKHRKAAVKKKTAGVLRKPMKVEGKPRPQKSQPLEEARKTVKELEQKRKQWKQDHPFESMQPTKAELRDRHGLTDEEIEKFETDAYGALHPHHGFPGQGFPFRDWWRDWKASKISEIKNLRSKKSEDEPAVPYVPTEKEKPERTEKKEPWQMTKQEWIKGLGTKYDEYPVVKEGNILHHKTLVQEAVSRGDPVTPNVLKDYPEIQKPSEPYVPTEKEKKLLLKYEDSVCPSFTDPSPEDKANRKIEAELWGHGWTSDGWGEISKKGFKVHRKKGYPDYVSPFGNEEQKGKREYVLPAHKTDGARVMSATASTAAKKPSGRCTHKLTERVDKELSDGRIYQAIKCSGCGKELGHTVFDPLAASFANEECKEAEDEKYATEFLLKNPIGLSDIEYYRGMAFKNRQNPHGIPNAVWQEAWKKVGRDGGIMVLDSNGEIYKTPYSVDGVIVNQKWVETKKQEEFLRSRIHDLIHSPSFITGERLNKALDKLGYNSDTFYNHTNIFTDTQLQGVLDVMGEAGTTDKLDDIINRAKAKEEIDEETSRRQSEEWGAAQKLPRKPHGKAPEIEIINKQRWDKPTTGKDTYTDVEGFIVMNLSEDHATSFRELLVQKKILKFPEQLIVRRATYGKYEIFTSENVPASKYVAIMKLFRDQFGQLQQKKVNI